MDILYIIVGITLLYAGGEWVLTGALSAAEKLNIPKVLSAVVLVGFGTSAPELFVGVNAMIAGQADMSLGNVLGSNIANILLISGFGMVLAPMVHKIKYIGLETIFFIGSSFLLVALMFVYGGIYDETPLVMLFMILIYFVMAARRPCSDEMNEVIVKMSVMRIIGYLLSGFVLLLVGAESLIIGSVELAQYWGISQAVIGLSIIAVGTSLPELATTIAAARRNEGEMIIGSVLGSNIFNTLLILGAVTSIDYLDLSFEVFGYDILIGAILSIVFVCLMYMRKLTRPVGIVFLILYGLYVMNMDNALISCNGFLLI